MFQFFFLKFSYHSYQAMSALEDAVMNHFNIWLGITKWTCMSQRSYKHPYDEISSRYVVHSNIGEIYSVFLLFLR